MSSESIKLRVTGLGHTLTFDMNASTTTIQDLKKYIESKTQNTIPAIYQRLLAHGKKLDDNDEHKTLQEAGIKDRTKIMLLHNALYIQEKESFEILSNIAKEIDDLLQLEGEGTKQASVTSKGVMSELVTRICCKLDSVEINGSEYLRSMRRDLIRKAECIDSDYSSSTTVTTSTGTSTQFKK